MKYRSLNILLTLFVVISLILISWLLMERYHLQSEISRLRSVSIVRDVKRDTLGVINAVNDSLLNQEIIESTDKGISPSERINSVFYSRSNQVTTPQDSMETIESQNQYLVHSAALQTKYRIPMPPSGQEITSNLKGIRINLGELSKYGFLNSRKYSDLLLVFGVRPADLSSNDPREKYFTISIVRIDKSNMLVTTDITPSIPGVQFALEYCDACPPSCPIGFGEVFGN